MDKPKEVEFDNEIVKQGNSFCVRIPKSAITYMELDVGDAILVKIKPLSALKEEKLPKSLLDIYRKTLKQLNDFSDKELNKCFFNLAVEQNAIRELKKPEAKRVSNAFEKTLEMEMGKKFLKKYQIFKKVNTKENTWRVMRAIKKSKYKEMAEAFEMQVKAGKEKRG